MNFKGQYKAKLRLWWTVLHRECADGTINSHTFH